MKVRGCTFPESVRLVAGVLGLSPSSLRSHPRPAPKREKPDLRSVALRFDIHGVLLKERADATLHQASGLDCTTWSGHDFDAAMKAVIKVHDDLAHADVLFDVADSQRIKAHKEGQ